MGGVFPAKNHPFSPFFTRFLSKLAIPGCSKLSKLPEKIAFPEFRRQMLRAFFPSPLPFRVLITSFQVVLVSFAAHHFAPAQNYVHFISLSYDHPKSKAQKKRPFSGRSLSGGARLVVPKVVCIRGALATRRARY